MKLDQKLSPRSVCSQYRAFTRTDLLVAVAVVTVLAALIVVARWPRHSCAADIAPGATRTSGHPGARAHRRVDVPLRHQLLVDLHHRAARDPE